VQQSHPGPELSNWRSQKVGTIFSSPASVGGEVKRHR
jgi:hypothetical protein